VSVKGGCRQHKTGEKRKKRTQIQLNGPTEGGKGAGGGEGTRKGRGAKQNGGELRGDSVFRRVGGAAKRGVKGMVPETRPL